MTDERLAQLWLLMENTSWREVNALPAELLQALKAERLYAASLEGKLSAADILEEARLKRIRELEAKLERVRRLPAEWRGAWELELRMAADDLEEALGDE